MHSALQFFGYVGAFWLVWKVLDIVYHMIFGRKTTTICDQCAEKENQIQTLLDNVKTTKQSNSNSQDRQIRQLNEEINKLRRSAKACNVVSFLNKSNRRQLEEIHGIGPVNSQLVIDRRPFLDYEDARRRLNPRILRSVEWANGIRAYR